MSPHRRITLNLDSVLIEKIRQLAYWTEKTIPDIILPGVEREIKKYEKAHGPLKPIPRGKAVRKGRPKTGSVYDRARMLAYNLGISIAEVIGGNVEKQIRAFEKEHGPMKSIPPGEGIKARK